MTDSSPPDVVVAVLTYRRSDNLRAVLPHLLRQAGQVVPPASVLVVDNDTVPSASALVAALTEDGRTAQYRHEPQPGIAAARNTALDEAVQAGARAVVFIDDDEIPEPGWLATLVEYWQACGADAVAGPVLARYPPDIGPWLRDGGLFDRPRRATGTKLHGAATNNLLLDLEALHRLELRFNPDFGITGGSDTMLTHAMVRAGADLRWCDEAQVSEEVSAGRSSRRWVLRRAFRTGNVWGRVAITLARQEGSLARVANRGELLARAVKRVAEGLLRANAGVLSRNVGTRARGAADVAAGLGLATSVFGYVYTEYRR